MDKTNGKTDSKKERVLGRNKKSRRSTYLISSVAIASAIVVVLVVTFSGGDARRSDGGVISGGPLTSREQFNPGPATGGRRTPHAEVEPRNGAVVFDVASFQDREAKYFTLKTQSGAVDFFVLMSSDGVIRAAFDACDVCFQARKGYRQAGDLMICNNCGQQFPSVRINVEEGGCNPSPLPRTIQGDSLVINVADIRNGARFF